MLNWLKDNPALLWGAGLSLILLIAGLFAAPPLIAALPADFFSAKRKEPLWLNIAGWALVVAGIAMLVFPGPGLGVLLMGIVLADFPGKMRLLRWILSLGPVLRTMNAVRKKRGKPPFKALR